MVTRLYVSINQSESLPNQPLDELTAEQSSWFAVPGDVDDFIFWDDEGGPSEK